MKYILCTLSLVVLGAVALAVGPAQAQTTAPGPYYATPSWDQTIACTTKANCPRFIVLSNMGSAAVLDRETGLVWERSPSTFTLNWDVAQSECNNLGLGNRRGWKLPTIQELMSLVDPSVGGALPAGHPFTGVQDVGMYWSATTGSRFGGAWALAMFDGLAVPQDKSDSLFFWCVRGGRGVDAQ